MRFNKSPVPELSIQLFPLVTRTLTSYGLTVWMQVIFRRDSDEELLGKPGRLLTETLGCAPEHLLFPAQMFYIVERIFPGLKTPHSFICLLVDCVF